MPGVTAAMRLCVYLFVAVLAIIATGLSWYSGAHCVGASDDYYARLQLPRDASAAEVRQTLSPIIVCRHQTMRVGRRVRTVPTHHRGTFIYLSNGREASEI